MKDSRVCIKCKSKEIIAGIKIVDRGHLNAPHEELSAQIQEDLGALIATLKHFTISAWVCADCGYTELYVDQPAKLAKSHKKFMDGLMQS